MIAVLLLAVGLVGAGYIMASTHRLSAILFWFLLAFLSCLVWQAISAQRANAQDVWTPDYVGRSLDKTIVVEPGGSTYSVPAAPGSGTSYAYPRPLIVPRATEAKKPCHRNSHHSN